MESVTVKSKPEQASCWEAAGPLPAKSGVAGASNSGTELPVAPNIRTAIIDTFSTDIHCVCEQYSRAALTCLLLVWFSVLLAHRPQDTRLRRTMTSEKTQRCALPGTQATNT